MNYFTNLSMGGKYYHVCALIVSYKFIGDVYYETRKRNYFDEHIKRDEYGWIIKPVELIDTKYAGLATKYSQKELDDYVARFEDHKTTLNPLTCGLLFGACYAHLVVLSPIVVPCMIYTKITAKSEHCED